MTPEHQQQIWDEAKAYDHNYYKSKAILEPKDHYANGYIAGYNAKHEISPSNGIVWHSIAEGHVPHIPDGENYIDHLLLYHEELKICTKGAYWFAETGFWRHNTGNWQPTHFAYINYPEPENSVKEQSS